MIVLNQLSNRKLSLNSLYALDMGSYHCDIGNIDIAVAVNIGSFLLTIGQSFYALDVSSCNSYIGNIYLVVAVCVTLQWPGHL